jgi:hypothetical protein
MQLHTFHHALRARRRLPLALMLALIAIASTGCGGNDAQATATPLPELSGVPAATTPATLAEARRVLDLSQLQLPQGAEVTASATSAATGFKTSTAIEATFAGQRAALEGSGWSLVGDAQIYPQSASGVFRNSGYVLSLTVMPDGAGSMVQMQHHGNVDLATLTPPEGVNVRFAQAISAIWETAAATDVAASALRDSLLAAGWEEYGEAGPMRYFRRNAVRLSTMTSAGPDGKTMHNLGVELLSAQIPMPAAASRADFDGSAQSLRVHHAGPIATLVQAYSSQLAADGWKTSIEAPIEDEGKQVMTWRNAADDMLMLTFAAPQGEAANVVISYQSKAQLDAMNARLDAQAEAWRKRNSP